MRLIPTLIASSLTAIICSSCSDKVTDAETAETVRLFNGENLDGWSAVLVDPQLNKHDVWTVKDGMLYCKGKPLGYLQTNDAYQNFILSLEWRWAPGTEPTNSGVLLRINGEPESFLPESVEAQLKHGSAGDIWAFYGASVEGDPQRFQEIDSEKIGKFRGVSKIKAVENPAGEWNHYEIVMNGDSMTLHINGEKINEAHGLQIISGPIGLQSEGSEIHFRNIELTKLK